MDRGKEVREQGIKIGNDPHQSAPRLPQELTFIPGRIQDQQGELAQDDQDFQQFGPRMFQEPVITHRGNQDWRNHNNHRRKGRFLSTAGNSR